MKLFQRRTLAREITTVLLIKLVLLFGLWYAFFRDIPQRHVDTAGVRERILGNGAPDAAYPRSLGAHR